MTSELKQKCIILAKEINEAVETLEIALVGEEREKIEAKNIVANVLRSHKSLLDGLAEPEKSETLRLFEKKIDTMAQKAKSLR